MLEELKCDHRVFPIVIAALPLLDAILAVSRGCMVTIWCCAGIVIMSTIVGDGLVTAKSSNDGLRDKRFDVWNCRTRSEM